MRPETLKLLEENIGKTLQDIKIGNNFLDQTPKTQETKAGIDKWDFTKVKNFHITQATVKSEETISRIRENISNLHI